MRRDGLLHPELLAVVADLGHGQSLCIADPGLPIPADVPVITLAYAPGRPSFVDVVEAVLTDLVVESATVADELDLDSPLARSLTAQLKSAGTSLGTMPHEDLKRALQDCVAVVRTGEFTPYANVILEGGVPF